MQTYFINKKHGYCCSSSSLAYVQTNFHYMCAVGIVHIITALFFCPPKYHPCISSIVKQNAMRQASNELNFHYTKYYQTIFLMEKKRVRTSVHRCWFGLDLFIFYVLIFLHAPAWKVTYTFRLNYCFFSTRNIKPRSSITSIMSIMCS